jgi:EAL domain-containing protein (putative c-di-GMP-specific phosphodiesterase class I)/GGDEF domain-containing protein
MALVVRDNGSICAALQAPDGSELPDSIGEMWPGETADRVRNNVRRVLRSREFFTEELNDGDSTTEHIYVAQGRDRVLLIVRDTSRRHRAMSRLERLAFVDDVTGLPNREFFHDELKKVCEYQRLRGGRAAVICIHIEDVGERHGSSNPGRYSAILQELCERLVRELRGANSLDDEDFERRTVVARIDFHRIGIILPAIETGTDAESVTERLMQRLQQPVEAKGANLTADVYAGIGLFPQDGADAKTIAANCNAATEEARAGEPGNISFHSGTVQLRTLQRQDLEVEIKTALERNAFTLNFLPIIDSASNKVRSVEALLRWPGSVMGSHSTSKIIGLAERTGLIVAIGEFVLRESFCGLRAWQDAGLADLRLSVNLSMQEFSRPDIAPRMAALILEAGIQPGDINLEITEKMLARDALVGFQVLDALKALGVNLHVDDYGTAACSMAQLAHSPIDGIKLDNSLVAGLETCDRDRAACYASIASAHALGLEVTAEGVETQAQVDALRAAGCDMLQGFYFTKPMTFGNVQSFIEAGREGRDDD